MIADLKSILKHGSVYSLGNMLSKVVGFVMIPVYTSYLTPKDYGTLELLTLVSIVLSTVLALRMSSGMTRFYVKYKRMEERNRLVSTLLTFIIGLAIVSGIALSFNSSLFSRLVFESDIYSSFFIFIFITLSFELVNSVAFTYLRIIEKSLIFIIISIIQMVLGLGMNIFFIVVKEWGVQGILYSMVISNGVVCLILMAITFKRVKFSFHPGMLKPLIKFGLPLIPAGMLIFILNMGDRFLMNRLADLTVVGLYALGYKFGGLLSTFIGGPFLSIWAPKRVEIYENRANKDEIFVRVFKYFTFALALTGLAISVLIRDVLQIIAAPEYWQAYRVVPFIVLGYIFYNLYYFVDIGFYVKNKTYWYLIINAVAAVVNIGLNLLLIPRWGAMGAAVVTAISFAVCTFSAFLVSRRYYKINYDLLALIKLVVVIVLFYVAGVSFTAHNIFIDLSVKLILIAAAPVTLYLIGYFDAKEVTYFSNFLQNRWRALRPRPSGAK
jgi:O-antigen/teichoic acid export membrane protein